MKRKAMRLFSLLLCLLLALSLWPAAAFAEEDGAEPALAVEAAAETEQEPEPAAEEPAEEPEPAVIEEPVIPEEPREGEEPAGDPEEPMNQEEMGEEEVSTDSREAPPDNGWYQAGIIWMYYVNGKPVKDRDMVIDGATYHFKPDGKMVTGYFTDSKGERYFGSDGKMRVNYWHKPGAVYYYYGADGYLVTNQEREINGKTYRFDADGRMVTTKWDETSNGWRFFGPDGHLLKSEWLKQGLKRYYFNASGYMVTNKANYAIDGKYYGFDADGVMLASKWVRVGQFWRYYGADGALYISCWAKAGDYWYYFDRDGYTVYSETPTCWSTAGYAPAAAGATTAAAAPSM